jgi:hypothetical protein
VMKVNNKTICTSSGEYSKGAKEAGTWDALSSMSVCTDVFPVKKGDIVTVVAKYDMEAHPARSHADGREAEEMGLALFSFAGEATTGSADGFDIMSTLNKYMEDAAKGLFTITAVPVAGSLVVAAAGMMAPFAPFFNAFKSAS